jgi:hypothetical protein
MPSFNAPRYDSQTLRSPTVFCLARSTSGGSRTAGRGRTGGGGGSCRADVGGVARRLGRLGAGAAGGLKAGCCCRSCSGVGLLEGDERWRGAAAFVARARCGPALQHLAHELLTANMASGDNMENEQVEEATKRRRGCADVSHEGRLLRKSGSWRRTCDAPLVPVRSSV